MNARNHAIRVGVRRGWTEFRLGLRSPEDLGYYLGWSGGLLIYLLLNRGKPVEGSDVDLASLTLPGALAAMIIFGAVVGPAFALVIEREDGTLLRAKAAPNGMVGYVAGQLTLQSLSVLPVLAILLIPTALLFDDVMSRGPAGWLGLIGLLVLALTAGIPIGMVIGSLARKPSHVSTWGMLPLLALAAFSGIFNPITNLPGWLQTLVQVFPVYWMGTGMRWAFLPDSAAALELGGTWHTGEAVLVLLAWSVVGLLLAPRVLRRMARRESGSAVEARRQQRMQRIA